MRGPDAAAALRRHVELLNAGVTTGDFGPVAETMAPYGEVRFTGVLLGPLRGREAIQTAYDATPPQDQIVLLDVHRDGGRASGSYAWASDAARRVAGRVTVTVADDGLIEETEIAHYPEPFRW